MNLCENSIGCSCRFLICSEEIFKTIQGNLLFVKVVTKYSVENLFGGNCCLLTIPTNTTWLKVD